MRGLLRQEAPNVGGAGIRERCDALAAKELKACAHVALIRLARQIGQTVLHTAVDEEVSRALNIAASAFGQAPLVRCCFL